MVCLTDQPGLDELYFPTLEQTAAALAPIRDDSFVFVAHPFRHCNDATPALERILGLVDGVEMNSVNILRRNALKKHGLWAPLNHDKYAWAQQTFGLVPVFNSDCHQPAAVGAVCTELELDRAPANVRGLALALKSARVSQRQNPQALDACLGGL